MTYDTVVIGGGIVGLAVALDLSARRQNLRLAVVEKEAAVGRHQSGNNSGVIHAGIYYRPGSLKARLCIEGRRMLIDFCNREGIPYEQCGKLIVATDVGQLPVLDTLYRRGIENGLSDIRMVSAGEMGEIEPHVRGLRAIRVPYTGIIDYPTVCKRYARRIQKAGGDILCRYRVTGLRSEGRKIRVITDRAELSARLVINCGGLFSDRIARMAGARPDVRIVPFRGEYFRLRPEREHLVRHLIYPVPDPAFPFLGVHFTRMINGGVEAGPNAVFAMKREGYRKTDLSVADLWEAFSWPGFRSVARKYWRVGLAETWRSVSKRAFAHALQKLVPEIRKADLAPGGAGVRAQACDRSGRLLDDFAIEEEPGIIHVLNAPSPAATASLAIGRTIADRAMAQGRIR